MKKKKSNLQLATMVLLFIAIVLSCIVAVYNVNNVYAETAQDIAVTREVDIYESDEIEPYLFTSLSISINGGDGKVWATVKNDFTLFPSTVIVVVMLYSSESYTESYTDMTLVSTNTTNDLNMGDTIKTEASTGGAAKYWIARMRYKIDSNSWASKATEVCKIGANGEFLGYV